MKNKIVVSGFKPLHNWQHNASEELIVSLQQELPEKLRAHEQELKFLLVPADTNQIEETAEKILGGAPIKPESAPRLCILFGQARGRNKISLERFAINMLHFNEPDGAGNVKKHSPIINNGEAAYISNVSELPKLVEKLQSHSIPAEVSHFAGTSLCNQLLYVMLKQVQTHQLTTQVLFVHIPISPAQAIEQWHDAPSMSQELKREALSIILNDIIKKR